MYVSQNRVRSQNLVAVAELVRSSGGCSRSEIGDVLGFNKATVSGLVGELISRGLLENAGQLVVAGPGRPRTIDRPDTTAHVSLVVEILPDRVRLSSWTLAATALDHRVLDIDPVSLGPDLTMRHTSGVIARWVRRLTDSGRSVTGVAVSVPGLVNAQTGRLLSSTPLQWHDVDIPAALHRRRALRDLDVIVERVANLATAAEWRQAPGREDFVCLHGGETGLGVGVVTGGRLLTGAHGRAGGLLFADNASGQSALRLATPPPDYLGFVELLEPVRNRNSTFGEESAALLSRLGEGDDAIDTALANFSERLGVRVAALLELFDPSEVVFSGPLAPLADHIIPSVRQVLSDSGGMPDVKLLAGRSGPEASLVGSALVLADHAFTAVDTAAA